MSPRYIYLILLALCSSGAFVFAEDADKKENEPHVLELILENDLLYNPAPGAHQDRHYTQGTKLIYFDRGEPTPGWAKVFGLTSLADHLPTIGFEKKANNYVAVLGQNIYTPEDNFTTNVIATDRPYAGWLYTGFAIQQRGTMSFHDLPTMESYELNIGVIGPEAQGEQAQNFVHRVRNFATFNGWDNQLKTEPAFVIRYGRASRWTVNTNTGRWFDVTPYAGVNLGTVSVEGKLGTTLRLGWNLPDDFGVQTIDSPILMSNGAWREKFGFYIYGRAEGRAVGRDVFLDGNLYQDSHHVDKKPLVADLSYGAAVALGKHVELSWTFITRTREFDYQKGNDQFGSVTGKLRWGF